MADLLGYVPCLGYKHKYVQVCFSIVFPVNLVLLVLAVICVPMYLFLLYFFTIYNVLHGFRSDCTFKYILLLLKETYPKLRND